MFTGDRSPKRPMSENAVFVALRSLSVDAQPPTARAFRAAARTILDEMLGERVDLIEHQLGHVVRHPLGARIPHLDPT